MNLLVTGACGVTSRAVVRSLRMSRHFAQSRIIGTDICKNQYGAIEHLCDQYYRIAHAESDRYAAEMNAVLARERIDAAIIMTEKEALQWSRSAYPVKSLVSPPRFSEIAISKLATYHALAELDIVPRFIMVDAGAPDENAVAAFLKKFSVAWTRSVDGSTTSGLGSLLIKSPEQLRAWLLLNPGRKTFMLSEYLSGRNFACCLLYYRGKLIKHAIYERLEYFMGHLVPSGISGNISRGKLVNEPAVVEVSTRAVEHILRSTGETMHGLITVDLKGDPAGAPKLTEINLRHTAATSAFAAGGANMAEAQLWATLGQPEQAGPLETLFPEDNLILRDIDGLPLWLEQAGPTLARTIQLPERGSTGL